MYTPVLERLAIQRDDITQFTVDAIVNAANNALSGGGGVDGAIHRAAGPELKQACRKLGRCATGQAVITAGYNLPAKYVIHAVGPVWRGGSHGEADLLASCYRQSLNFTEKYDIQTIAFPAISTGAYGYPRNQATQIALTEVIAYLNNHTHLNQVIFACFDAQTYRAYQQRIQNISHS